MEKNLLLLIILFNFIKADAEFIFSCKLRIHNSSISNQTIYISKAMVKTKAKKSVVCKIDKKRKPNESILKYLKRYKEELFECFQKERVFINYHQLINQKKLNSETTITMEPINFTVNFNQGFGIISTFKNR